MDKNLVKYLLPILCLFDLSTAAEDTERNKELNLQPKTKLNRLEGQIISPKGVKTEVLTDFVNVAGKKDDYESALDIASYQKVKLIDVVLETLAHSDILKSAREKVIQFEIKVDDALANFRPTLDLEYTYGRTKKNPSGEADTQYKFFDDNYARLIFRQNLYSGGANDYEVKSVTKKLEVAQNQYRIALEEEIKKAIKAYFGVVFANRTVIVNERNMKKLNKILQIVTTKYDNGAASIADLTSIKASVANAMTKLVRVKSKFIESIRFYEYIVGGSFDKTLPYEKDFEVTISNFDDLFDRAIDRNRNLLNYYKSIEAETFKIKSNESVFEPKVDLEFTYKKIYDKEDYEETEDSVNSKVKVSYNLYNAGRDKNKILEVASDIRDLKYRLNEEKKKIKWNLSKLYTSTQSVSQALESTVVEIQASRKAVSAYWDAFKLGEQDLPTLLQGQRQLNSAETELVKFEEDYVSNFFDILELTGDLAAFFDVDPSNLKFIDFSKSSYSKTINTDNSKNLGLDLKTGELKDKNLEKEDILKQEEELKQELVIEDKALEKIVEKKSIDENINLFIEKFLTFDDESFMIQVSSFGNIYEAFNFIKENNIDENSLPFDVIDNYELKTKIAHNNFVNIEEAQKYVEELESKELNKTFEIKKVGEIKELYESYKSGLKVEKPEPKVKTKIKVVEKIMQPVKKKEFETNEVFKNEFLSTNDNKFTINVSTFTNLKTLETLINENSLYETSFFFRYGDNGELIKLVNGIFDNYVTAEQSLVTISSIDNKLFPVIERIGSVKNLYNENIEFNTKKEEPIEYEYINVSNKQKVKISKDEKAFENIIKKEVKTDDIENSYKLADAEFIKQYLAAPRDYYTLNIAAFDSMEDAEDYVDRNYIEKDTILVISNSGKIMVMYGIYPSSSDAKNSLKDLPEFITRNNPIIQKIYRTQDSFVKNNLKKSNAIEEASLEKDSEQKALEEQRIAQEKAQKEAEEKAKAEAERLEQERILAEQKALEEQRIAQEKAQKEAEEKAKAEAERLEQERILAEQKALEEQRIAQEKAQKEAEEKARLEAERLEQERILAEQKALEEQRIAQEKAQKEAEEKAKAEAERLEQERILAEQKALEEQRIAQAKAQKEAEEKARLEAERLEQERILSEQKALEEQRIAQEKAQKEAEEKTLEKTLEKNTEVKENSNNDKFTIKLTTIDNSKIKWFVYRFSIGNDYKVVKRAGNQSDIFFGDFNSNEEALKAIDSLHPRLEPIVIKLGDSK